MGIWPDWWPLFSGPLSPLLYPAGQRVLPWVSFGYLCLGSAPCPWTQSQALDLPLQGQVFWSWLCTKAPMPSIRGPWTLCTALRPSLGASPSAPHTPEL